MKSFKFAAAALSCCLVAGTAAAYCANISETAIIADAKEYTWGSLTYEIKDKSYIVITGADHMATSLTIPSKIDGVPVKEIGKDAFEGLSALKTIVISEGVTEIGSSAFYNCAVLKNVTLPKSLKAINYNAFAHCISLEKIDIPKGVTKIESGAFKDCVYLHTLEFPAGIESISQNVAEGCTLLDNVVINNGPSAIYYDAFKYCSSLKTITIPLSVSSIFSGWYDVPLKDVYYSGSVLQWDKIDGKGYVDDAKIHYGEKAPVPSPGGGSTSNLDIDGDGKIDASDASEILMYYAYLSTGGTLDYPSYVLTR